MLNRKEKRWAEHHYYQQGDGYFYSVKNGVPFTIFKKPNQENWSLSAYLPFLDTFEMQNLIEHISQMGQASANTQIELHPPFLVVSFDGKDLQVLSRAENIACEILQYCIRQEKEFPSICMMCHKPCENTLYDAGDMTGFAHYECMKKIATSSKPSFIYQKKSRYLEGFTGALLFATLCQIVFTLISLFRGIYMDSFLLLIASAVFTAAGYERFKGDKGKGKKWIVTAVYLFTTVFFSVFTAILHYSIDIASFSARVLYFLFHGSDFFRWYYAGLFGTLIRLAIVTVGMFVYLWIEQRQHKRSNRHLLYHDPMQEI